METIAECRNPTQEGTPGIGPTSRLSGSTSRLRRLMSPSASLIDIPTFGPSPDLSANIFLKADCPTFYVRSGTVLNTRIGLWLDKRKLLTPLILLLVIAILLIYFLKPHPRILEVTSADGVTNRHKRLGPSANTSLILIFMLEIFLVLHRSNKDVFFQSVFSFECLIVVASFVQIRAAEFYNYEVVYCAGGVCDWRFRIEEIVISVIYPIPCGLAIGACDSWMVSSWRKILYLLCCSILAAVRYSEQWSDPEEKGFWSSKETCFWTLCGSPKIVYVSGHFQVLAFIGKALAAYARGVPFAFVRPEYRFPGTDPLEVRIKNCCFNCLGLKSEVHAEAESSVQSTSGDAKKKPFDDIRTVASVETPDISSIPRSSLEAVLRSSGEAQSQKAHSGQLFVSSAGKILITL